MLIALSVGSAFFYVVSAYAMKQWGSLGLLWGVPLLGICIFGGVWLEIEALQRDRLGTVFILITGFECLLAVLCAWLFLSETNNWAELSGMALIILGALLTQLEVGDAAA